MATKKNSTSGRGRTRNFATVVYPESAPGDWQKILSDLHVAALVSPLHDKDLNPDGTPKKPHWHVLLMFDSVKDIENQVRSMVEKFGGVGVEKVNSLRGYARYLCHLDNPEKHQYDPADVVSFGGADFGVITYLPTDDVATLREIFAYIRANGIFSLAELLDVTGENNPEWFLTIATKRCYIIDKYIKSLAWEVDAEYVRSADRKNDDTPAPRGES